MTASASTKKPALTREGFQRDSQRARMYAWGFNSPSMAAGGGVMAPLMRWSARPDGEPHLEQASDRHGLLWTAKSEGQPLDMPGVIELVERVCAGLGLEAPPVEYKARKNARTAHLEWQRPGKGSGPLVKHPNGRFYRVRIVLPDWGFNAWVVLHELAHYVHYSTTADPTEAQHGPEFTGVYLALLERYGPPDFDRGAAEADACRRGVRWTDPAFAGSCR